MEKGIVRQGDVLVVPVDKIPEGAKEKEGLTLAEGEVTGHSHRVDGEGLMFTFNDKTYLRIISEVATLQHEEHGHIALTRGDYEIKIQQEYKPDRKTWARVMD